MCEEFFKNFDDVDSKIMLFEVRKIKLLDLTLTPFRVRILKKVWDSWDWQRDAKLQIHLDDGVCYRLHV